MESHKAFYIATGREAEKRWRRYQADLTEPYTEYLVEMAAASDYGYGEFTAEYPVLTDTKAPSMPRNLRVTPKNETSLHLEWDTPKRVYGRLDSYAVNFRDRSAHSVRKTIPGGNLTEYTLVTTDLIPGELYDVTLAGVTKSISGDKAHVGLSTENVPIVLGDTNTLLLNLYEKIDSLEQRVKQVSNEATNSVIFYASLIEDAYLEEEKTVRFDDVMVNEGRAYSESTGVFTAPLDGIYAFQISARLEGPCEITESEVEVAIAVRGHAVSKLRFVPGSVEQGTISKVVSLNQGDGVEVVPTFVNYRPKNSDYYALSYNQYTTFSGHLVKGQ